MASSTLPLTLVLLLVRWRARRFFEHVGVFLLRFLVPPCTRCMARCRDVGICQASDAGLLVTVGHRLGYGSTPSKTTLHGLVHGPTHGIGQAWRQGLRPCHQPGLCGAEHKAATRRYTTMHSLYTKRLCIVLRCCSSRRQAE